jgi:hypothetical protein
MERAMAKDSSDLVRNPFASDGEPWSAVHLLSMAMDDPLAGLAVLLTALDASQAKLRSLSIKPAGSRFEAILRIDGVTCEAARDLADYLAGQAALSAARVEHHLFTGPESSSAGAGST